MDMKHTTSPADSASMMQLSMTVR